MFGEKYGDEVRVLSMGKENEIIFPLSYVEELMLKIQKILEGLK